MNESSDVEPRDWPRTLLAFLAIGLWSGMVFCAVLGAARAASHGYAADGLWINALRSVTDPLPSALALGAVAGLIGGGAWGGLRGARPRRGPTAIWLALLAATPLALGVGAIVGARGLAAQRAADPDRLNVMLLLIDTLRADRLGAYGYERDTSPTIDRLAAESTFFERAISPADKTRTAMASLWTGLYPSRHGLFSREHILSDRIHTAAEWAREAGFRTAAFAPNPSLDRKFGHAQGWDLYVDRALRADRCDDVPEVCFETARRIQRMALDWIDEDPGRPFLLWVHYRDVHGPYVPPPPYDAMFRSETPRPMSEKEVRRRNEYLTLPDDGNDLNHYLDRYDGGIRYTDDRIGEFLEALDERGLLENTLIVLVADHGEEFLEHGDWNHGHSLYEEMVHVPLIVRWPGAPPRVEKQVVSTLAFFPTILRAMGIDPQPTDGVDLVPLVRDGEPLRLPEYVFSERKHGKMRSVRHGDWKHIVNDEEGWSSLYDLAGDPGEHRDRSAEESARSAALAGALERFGDDVANHPAAPSTTVDLDDELRERLEALGYVE